MSQFNTKLYILPFDHRSSFIKAFLGDIKVLGKQQIKLIKSYKQIIFEAFLLVSQQYKNNQACAIMVDEQYGQDIIKTAKRQHVRICLPTEKSGQKTFALEYGKKFVQHILEIKPQVVKALVRYNPNNIKINLVQLKKLKVLSDWCQVNSYKLMVEALVPPTTINLNQAHHKKETYDIKIRPALTLKMIQEFHQAGIEPNIWKIEAFESIESWYKIIDLIRDGESREQVGIIMLGRGESFAKVKQWMNIAPRHLLNGFAVGRTVFMRPLQDFNEHKINKNQVIKEIAKNYLELIKYWEKK